MSCPLDERPGRGLGNVLALRSVRQARLGRGVGEFSLSQGVGAESVRADTGSGGGYSMVLAGCAGSRDDYFCGFKEGPKEERSRQVLRAGGVQALRLREGREIVLSTSSERYAATRTL